MGGAKVDVDGAVKLLEERVKEKDGEAMWMLGLCKEYGRGIERDIEGAKKLYKESKETGNEIGEILLWKGGKGRGRGEMRIYGLEKQKRKDRSKMGRMTLMNDRG